MQTQVLKPICLLFGANGQVGFELRRSLALDYDVIALDRAQCDMSDAQQISRAIQTNNPALIINAAAYTAVDNAETESDLAFAINAHALQVIAQEAKKIHAAVVHYSTVFVFSGEAVVPYSETDSTNPLNSYGQSKLLGEELLIKHLGKDYPCWILRASWVYGLHGNNFLKQMIRLARNKTSLSVVADELGAPISATLMADLTLRILQKRPAPGIYHVSTLGQTNRYEYAKFIFEQAEKFGLALQVIPDNVLPVSSEHFHAIAIRPKFIIMDCDKLQHALSINLPDWRLDVEQAVRIIAENQLI